MGWVGKILDLKPALPKTKILTGLWTSDVKRGETDKTKGKQNRKRAKLKMQSHFLNRGIPSNLVPFYITVDDYVTFLTGKYF